MSTSNNSSDQNAKQNKMSGAKTMKKKQLKLWFLIPMIVFIGLIVILYMRLGKPTDIVTNTTLDRPVPAFELPLLSDTSLIMTNENLPDQPFFDECLGLLVSNLSH